MTRTQIQRYVGRISGPLLDRINIHIDVPAVKFRDLTGDPAPDAEGSTDIRYRGIKRRIKERERQTDCDGRIPTDLADLLASDSSFTFPFSNR